MCTPLQTSNLVNYNRNTNANASSALEIPSSTNLNLTSKSNSKQDIHMLSFLVLYIFLLPHSKMIAIQLRQQTAYWKEPIFPPMYKSWEEYVHSKMHCYSYVTLRNENI